MTGGGGRLALPARPPAWPPLHAGEQPEAHRLVKRSGWNWSDGVVREPPVSHLRARDGRREADLIGGRTDAAVVALDVKLGPRAADG